MPELSFPNVISWSVPIFLLALLTELYLAHRQKRPWFNRKDTWASLGMGVGSLLTGGLGRATVLGLHVFLYQHRLFDLGLSLWLVPICFLLQDLAFYWKHRFQHTVRWMWAEHVNHHSSENYNLSTALRQSWTGIIAGNWVFYLPLSFIGFHPAMTFFCAGLNLWYQFWIHTQTISRMPKWVEAVFNTPSHHRVHHARNPRYLDANYAGTLIVWDRLFGSFVAEHPDDLPVYGILHPVKSYNPLVIAFHEWRALLSDLRSARDLRDILGYTLGPPGWSPDGSRQTSKTLKAAWQRSQQTSAEATLAGMAGEHAHQK